MSSKRNADQAARLGVLFGDVHRGDERVTLGGEVGAGGLSVAELAATMRVMPSSA